MNTEYIFCTFICFICYLIRTVFNVMKYKEHSMVERKNNINAIYIVMGILWFSWFWMCFSDPWKVQIPTLLRYLGMFFFIVGIFLFALAHVGLRGFEGKGELVTGGIYSKIRNPMYLGFILWHIGFPLYLQSLITLMTSVVWITHIVLWKVLEEKVLEKQYEHYAQYKKKTWF